MFSANHVGRSRKKSEIAVLVIPAEAGIQYFQDVLDPGFRRGDGV
jgi:hypothetical protein